MFDAYTIKKVLPRLVIAVILIQLSWFITTGAIFVINQIAFGIEGLMYGAFGGTGFRLQDLLSDLDSSSTTIASTALFAVAGTAFAGGVIAIVGFVVISVIVAFLTLAIRRMLLILLVILSPVAIVAWILPNTERLWKMWWDNFSKLLLMFPMILAMIAAGRVFAKIAGTAGGSDIINTAIVLGGFFVPLLLIPKTYSLAGGAFAAIGGAVAQRGAGLQDKALGWGKARKAEKRKALYKRANENRLFDPTTRRGKMFNGLASTITDPKSALKIAMGTKGGKALASQIEHTKWEHTQKLAQQLSKAGFNDRALKALSGDEMFGEGDEGWDGTQEDLDRRIAVLRERAAQGDRNAAIGANLLEHNSGFLFDMHKNEEFARGSAVGAAGLALASQGFASHESIARIATQLNASDGGLGNTFKTAAELANAQAGGLTKPGYSVVQVGTDAHGNAIYGAAPESGKAKVARVRGMGVQDIAGAKAPQLKDEYHGTMVDMLTGTAEGATEQDSRLLADTLEQSYGAYTNPDIRAEIESILGDAEVARATAGMGGALSPEQEAQVRGAVTDSLRRRVGQVSPAELARQQAAGEAAQQAENNEEGG